MRNLYLRFVPQPKARSNDTCFVAPGLTWYSPARLSRRFQTPPLILTLLDESDTSMATGYATSSGMVLWNLTLTEQPVVRGAAASGQASAPTEPATSTDGTAAYSRRRVILW